MKTIKPKGKKRVRLFIFMVILFIFMAYCLVFTEKIVKPVISDVASIKVKAIVNQIVSESIHKEFASSSNTENLLSVKTDEAGKVSVVQPNVVLMNQLASQLSMKIYSRICEIEQTEVKVPMGSVLGSQILSQTGPTVNLKIKPLGVTKVNFKTEFESQGINQTRYKVFLETETEAKIIIPFTEESIVLSYVVPVAETVIIGDVPQSYVVIPDPSDIMDGMNLQ